MKQYSFWLVFGLMSGFTILGFLPNTHAIAGNEMDGRWSVTKHCDATGGPKPAKAFTLNYSGTVSGGTLEARIDLAAGGYGHITGPVHIGKVSLTMEGKTDDKIGYHLNQVGLGLSYNYRIAANFSDASHGTGNRADGARGCNFIFLKVSGR